MAIFAVHYTYGPAKAAVRDQHRPLHREWLAEEFKAGNVLPALTAAADTAAADPIIAGFQAVGADAVPMPAIPAMGAVWQYWGVAEAAIINGEDPAANFMPAPGALTASSRPPGLPRRGSAARSRPRTRARRSRRAGR